ncbi:MAG TPA: acetyl-CoA C-acyltransferase [Symbiobacteriaceae bacterium]|nr:acetyl-CoA C-acyltransferase [Symbiobacteriaceae bacterium]
MKEIVISAATRTAIGKYQGSLSGVGAIELGALAIKETIKRAGLTPEQVERVVLGENIQLTRGGNPARRVQMKAGWPIEQDSYTINMNCASGMRAVIAAAQDILLGEREVIVAGGMECMSQSPYVLEGARTGYRHGNATMYDFLADHILGDAGLMAEKMATTYGISREAQDEWAYVSQSRFAKAQTEGKFKDEIFPVEIPVKGGVKVFDTDEHNRPETTIESLAKLRPAFTKDGSVTAGNSSGINDGAAACVVTAADTAAKLGLKPQAYIRGWESAGVEPTLFGIGPVPATQKLLKKTGLKLSDIGLIEINEAFAVQLVYGIRELGLDPAIVNVNGGAVAQGHAVGATGVVIMIKLMNEMARRGVKYGIATMCIGSGQGMAVLLENAR